MKYLMNPAKVLVIILRAWEANKRFYMYGCVDEWYKVSLLVRKKKSLWLLCERENQLKERKRAASGPLFKIKQEIIRKDLI